MRLLGLEISRAPKKGTTVWVRSGLAPLGQLISEMRPEELRSELEWVAGELNKGNTLVISPRDKFKRVLSFQPVNVKQQGERK